MYTEPRVVPAHFEQYSYRVLETHPLQPDGRNVSALVILPLSSARLVSVSPSFSAADSKVSEPRFEVEANTRSGEKGGRTAHVEGQPEEGV